jgi:hypothetical protein
MAFHSPSRTSLASLPTTRPCARFARPSCRPSSHEVRRPSDAPNTGNPLPGGARSQSRSSARSLHLVAGFQARFGPPTPSLTTVTVCASLCPVVCLDHSHPWGFASPLLDPVPLDPKIARSAPEGRHTTRKAPGRCAPSRHRDDAPYRTTAPPRRMVRLRLPSTFASTCVRCLPACHPKMVGRPSLGCFTARLPGRPPRPLHRNETAATRWTRPRHRGCLSRMSRPPPACYREPGPVPPGMGCSGRGANTASGLTHCAHERCALAPCVRSRLPASSR